MSLQLPNFQFKDGGELYDQHHYESLALAGNQTTMDDQTTIDPTVLGVSTLSDGQEITLAVLQVCSALLSLVGSTTIVYKILRNHAKTENTPPYDRIMLGLSLCDIVASAQYALGPFLIPAATSQRVTAIGNEATCSGMGFLTQLGTFWAIWYNAILSFYYLLTVRFGVKRHEFCARYELPLHLTGIVFFPLTAVIGYFGNWYSEMELHMGCWVGEVPKGCTAAGTCTGKGKTIAYVYAAMPIVLTFFALVINNLIIYAYVRKSLLLAPQPMTLTESVTSKATAATAVEADNDDDIADVVEATHDVEASADEFKEEASARSARNNQANAAELQRTREKRLTREVAIQGFLYVSGFLVAYTPASVVQFLDSYGYGFADQEALYPLLVANSMLVPLQGFFNVFIYIRPTYNRFRAANPELPARKLLQKALFDPKIPRLGSTHHEHSRGSR